MNIRSYLKENHLTIVGLLIMLSQTPSIVEVIRRFQMDAIYIYVFLLTGLVILYHINIAKKLKKQDEEIKLRATIVWHEEQITPLKNKSDHYYTQLRKIETNLKIDNDFPSLYEYPAGRTQNI